MSELPSIADVSEVKSHLYPLHHDDHYFYFFIVNSSIFAVMCHGVFLKIRSLVRNDASAIDLHCLLFFLFFTHVINVILVLSLPILMSSTPPPSHQLRSFLLWTRTPTHPMPLPPPPSLLSLPLTTTPWAVIGNPRKSLSEIWKCSIIVILLYFWH